MLPMLLAGFLQTASVIPYVTPSSGLTPVRVLVIVQSSPSLPAPMSGMRREVDRIWRSAGVELTWTSRLPAGEVPFDRVITVDVEDAPFDRTRLPEGALGGVPIVAGRMRQMVFVSPMAVRRLLATTGITPASGAFGPVYARVVGRVIAHELGHLLLVSQEHSESGLMRPLFHARDALSTDPGQFSLGGDDVLLVHDRLATARRAGDTPQHVDVPTPLPARRR